MQLGIGLGFLMTKARDFPGEGPSPRITQGAGHISVFEHQLRFIELDGASPAIMAVGLISCASVVMASQDENAAARGAVFHAPGGLLSSQRIAEMHDGLGAPPVESLLAAYVIKNPWDKHYQDEAMNLEKYGLLANNVVRIHQFVTGNFGMNNAGQVGL